jgi:hypothetical protein
MGVPWWTGPRRRRSPWAAGDGVRVPGALSDVF